MTVYKAIKKTLITGAIFALSAAPVLAATTAQTSTSLSISAGALAITADASASFTGVTVSSSAQNTYTGSGLGNDASDIAVTAEDTRGESSPSGWDVTATATDLTAGGETIVVTNFTSNFSSVTVNSGSGTGVTAGTGGALADADTDGTSDSFTIITASSSNGQGNYGLDVGFDLSVPAYQAAGSYSGTVDLSVS